MKVFDKSLASDSGLTHSQIQIWTGQQIHPESAFANMAFAIIIEGNVDVERFQKAWMAVINNNEVLRSFIVQENGFPSLKIHEHDSCRTEFFDFSNELEPEEKFSAHAQKECEKPLSLDGELVVSHLVRISEQRFGWYLNQHHLVTDATATVNLFQAVSSAYENSNPVAQHNYYNEYAQAEADTVANREKARNHWKKKCSGNPRSNPIYGKTKFKPNTSSIRVEQRLSIEESNAIRELSGNPSFSSFFPDISLFALFSTVLSSLLYRISGNSQVSFDAPAGNRTSPTTKTSLGCFIEMFPINIELVPNDTYLTLGERCLIEILDFLSYVAPGASSPNSANSSNVALNYFPKSFGLFAGLPISATWIHPNQMEGVYDLNFQIHDYNATGCYTIQFDLDTSVFSEFDAQRIQHHFRSVLNALLENPNQLVASTPILTSDEIERTINKFNQSANNLLPNDTILHRIAAQAATSPNEIVLQEDSHSVTYEQFWIQVERGAKGLNLIGATVGTSVAILLPRSIEAIIAIVATLRAGAAYIPIDPKYPKNRVTKILSDSNAICVIGYPDSAHTTHTLNELRETPNTESVNLSFPKPEDLAYIIYTSGSTGQPKGVEIEHEGLIDYIGWAERSYTNGKALNYPLFTSLAFDLTITSLFLPLVTGGKLIVYPPPPEGADSAIIDVVKDNKVDFIKLTPSHLKLLNQIDLSDTIARCLVLGGEDLTKTLALSITRKIPHEVKLFNEYGPTECVVGCMIHRFNPEKIDRETSVPIGKPADNVKLYVLNEALAYTPEGTPGELFIARNGLARGYRNDPQKTETSFIAHPVIPNLRIYKTGDLVRFSSKGTLTYLGRIDDQVKIAGHRIELGEIENALLNHPSIKSAHITTAANSSSQSTNREILAYYESDIDIPYLELSKFLSSDIPANVQPTRFVRVPLMPLTINGKIDTDSLPNPGEVIETQKSNITLPDGPVEDHVYNLWAESIGIDSFSTEDSFFQLGGTSLSAMEITLQICRDFEVDLPLQTIFLEPTVVLLSKTIENKILSDIEALSDEEAAKLISNSSK